MKRLPKGFRIVTAGRVTIATLYQTDIAIINHQINTIQLETGDWFTKHTKKCLNLVLSEFGFTVSQRGGEWFVSHDDMAKEVPFQNGMILKYPSQYESVLKKIA